MTQTFILVAPLDAGSTVEARPVVGRTPVHEALASPAGESRLAGTVEGGRGLPGATSVVQAWIRVTRIDPMLTI